jgi:glyoxylase-like metal-dependent hydrolase (beta-lactamase superfamily II)
MFDDTIPLILGKGERDVNYFPFVYTTQIKSKKNIRCLDFIANGIDMPLLGLCVDLFHDGSFWAIDTHGHTRGHVSYLINGKDRIVLLAGDASITALGFSIGVESGSYSENMADTKVSFDKLKNFTATYSQVEMIFGHEATGQYDIIYHMHS